MDEKTTIFVFGSNCEGRHGKGAALEALKNWGAIPGQSMGLQGRSYAIVTKELRSHWPKVGLREVELGVSQFLQFARTHDELHFKVTAIGCGLAGFKVAEIAPFFENVPENVELPVEFEEELKRRRNGT